LQVHPCIEPPQVWGKGPIIHPVHPSQTPRNAGQTATASACKHMQLHGRHD
jgi:hypothetical protein